MQEMTNSELAPTAVKAASSAGSEPRRTRFTVPLYGLLGIALLYTLYFAKSLLIPIVVALLFSLLLSPLVTFFKRFYIPRVLSAIVLLAMIGTPVTILFIELAEPAQKWLAQLPKLSAQLNTELDNFSSAISSESAATIDTHSMPKAEKRSTFFGWFSSDDELSIAEDKPINGSSALSDRVTQGGIETIIYILGKTPVVIAQFLTFVVLVLFLLIFGPRLFESYLAIFPAGQDGRQSVGLIDKVQKELSQYIVAVTIINCGLGMVTAGVFWMMGVNDALLWGALISLLNFAPYVGPIFVLIVLSLAGTTQYGFQLDALLPAAVYFGINLLEAQFVTPTVLGRHMRLNPLILILWLLVWGWLWGPVGVLLAVPLLVCLKLAAGQLNVLTKWVRLIETST